MYRRGRERLRMRVLYDPHVRERYYLLVISRLFRRIYVREMRACKFHVRAYVFSAARQRLICTVHRVHGPSEKCKIRGILIRRSLQTRKTSLKMFCTILVYDCIPRVFVSNLLTCTGIKSIQNPTTVLYNLLQSGFYNSVQLQHWH